MRFTILSWFGFIVSTVHADIKFITPTPGTTTSSNTQISISWAEGGGANAISTLRGYTLTLLAGGSTDALATPVFSVTGDHSVGQKTNIMPISSPALGPPGVNAYFLKISSTSGTGSIIINYSDRFTLPGMTGTWASPAIQAAYNLVKGDITAVPATQIQGVANGAVPAPPAAGPQFQVPYSLQTTNKIMYAPMMNYPGPSITKKDTNRLYASSHWNLATTYFPPALQVQTITASRTVSLTTRENQATPASTAQNDMQRWLNRWKD